MARGRARRAGKSGDSGGQQVACDNSDNAIWLQRRAKREAGVRAMCKSHEYTQLLVLLSTGEIHESHMPSLPSADDRSISKRGWERAIAEYRARIRAIAAEFFIADSGFACFDMGGVKAFFDAAGTGNTHARYAPAKVTWGDMRAAADNSYYEGR